MTAKPKQTCAVLGAGSWGSALAILLARYGHSVHLWGHDVTHLEALLVDQSNQHYLPDIEFPQSLHIKTELPAALHDVSHIIVAVPSHAVQQLLVQIKPFLVSTDIGIIIASKGLDPTTQLLLPTLAQNMLDQEQAFALLSGPSFAKEVAMGMPTAVVLATHLDSYAQRAIALFHHENFRVYLCDDMVGVAIGGVVKNVMAIAAGISDGLGFGANARAALITRGLAEMMRLALAMQARAQTLMGLSGLGDLMLTATDNQSRNRRFGLALGQGHSCQYALETIGQVVEGMHNAIQVLALATQYQVDMPIVSHVQQVISGELTPQKAVHALLTRPPGEET